MKPRRPARLVARNLDTGAMIANDVTVASRVVDRAIGLLSRSSLRPGQALLITPCRGVHTWGMRFAIDVVALDESGVVVDTVSSLAPWRIRLPRRGARSVLELAAGTLQRSQTAPGHRIELHLTREWETA